MDAPAAVAEPPAGDFAAALMMIAALPLTDAEKAEAVRRLLAGRESQGIDLHDHEREFSHADFRS